MNSLKDKYRSELARKYIKKSAGPKIIPHKEHDKLTLSLIAKVAYAKLENYPTNKLWGIAGKGLLACFLMAMFTFQFGHYRLRKKEFNKLAQREFMEHKALLSILGEPIRFGNVFANKKDSIQETEVDVVVPVTGKVADGILKYKADKKDGAWILRDMQLEFIDEAGGIVQIIRQPGEATA